MNKFELATKAVGCLVVALIIAGMFNASLMNTFIPYILIGAAVTLALYIVTAFKTKNYGRMTAILILAAFVATDLCKNKALCIKAQCLLFLKAHKNYKQTDKKGRSKRNVLCFCVTDQQVCVLHGLFLRHVCRR